jgi:tetratricopeptide (TPR) repeat protein
MVLTWVMAGLIVLQDPCAGCGAKPKEGANFCSECGAAVSRKCGSCGAKVEPKDRFCAGCGASLRGAEAKPHLEAARRLLDEATRDFYRAGADFTRTAETIERARRELEKALAISPASAEHHLELGRSWMLLGRVDEAEKCLRRAVELDPKRTQPLGELLMERWILSGDPRVARKAAELLEEGAWKALAKGEKARALELAGKDRHNESLALITALAAENPKDRLEALDRALHFRPNYPLARLVRARIARELGDVEKADRDCTEAIRFRPSFVEAFCLRASGRTARGDIQGALQDYDEAIRIRPAHAESYVGRGAIYSMLGRQEEALHEFSRALELEPDRPEAYFNRAIVRAQLGERDAAKADLRRCLEVAPADWPHRQKVEESLRKLEK